MIKLDNVSHVYNEKTVMQVAAIKDINLEIHEGEFIGLIGHTGSGKSTLIQHLNGLLEPTSGKIYYDGEDVHSKKFKKSRLRSEVGLVFQYPEYQLFEDTIFKDISFGPKNMGLNQEEIEKRTKEALKLVNMGEEYYNKSPFALSGGQKRRVAIAGILAMKPKFLILDEPAAGLDPIGRNNILNGINHLNKKYGIGIIMVSHSMEDVARLADRIIVMNEGKLMYDDTPDKVFAHSEELEKIGLSIPVMTKLANKLKGTEYEIDTPVFTVEQAKEAILKVIKKRIKYD